MNTEEGCTVSAQDAAPTVDLVGHFRKQAEWVRKNSWMSPRDREKVIRIYTDTADALERLREYETRAPMWIVLADDGLELSRLLPTQKRAEYVVRANGGEGYIHPVYIGPPIAPSTTVQAQEE